VQAGHAVLAASEREAASAGFFPARAGRCRRSEANRFRRRSTLSMITTLRPGSLCDQRGAAWRSIFSVPKQPRSTGAADLRRRAWRCVWFSAWWAGRQARPPPRTPMPMHRSWTCRRSGSCTAGASRMDWSALFCRPRLSARPTGPMPPAGGRCDDPYHRVGLHRRARCAPRAVASHARSEAMMVEGHP